MFDEEKLRKATKYNNRKEVLREGEDVFIQTNGFLSGFENEGTANMFMERTVMLIIRIPEMQVPQPTSKFDHGFYQFGIQIRGETKDNFIVFNPLNIFRVTGYVEREQEGRRWTEYHLEYGVIYDLIAKEKRNQLTLKEKRILNQLKHSQEIGKNVKDEGDILLLSNNPEAVKQYYLRKK